MIVMTCQPSLVPYVAKTVSSATVTDDYSVTLATYENTNLFKWFLNNITMKTEWSDPTLLQVSQGQTTFNTSEAVATLPTANEWAYVLIQNNNTSPHPIHLHGHDFYILASGNGTYPSTGETLNLNNPPRRDVAMLPGGGNLYLAFKADNPGAWLMHCHIGWHQEGGFALQFVEQESKLKTQIDTTTLSNTCSKWNTWAAAHGETTVPIDDSGI